MFLKKICLDIPLSSKIYLLNSNKLLLILPNFFKIIFFNYYDKLLFSCIKKNKLYIFFKKTKKLKKFVFFNFFFKSFKKSLTTAKIFAKKSLKLVSIGYRVFLLDKLSKNVLCLKLGYSHVLFLKIPKDILIKIVKQVLYFSCYNELKLLNFCDFIRNLKVPDVYKGKGFFFEYGNIKLKKGKQV